MGLASAEILYLGHRVLDQLGKETLAFGVLSDEVMVQESLGVRSVLWIYLQTLLYKVIKLG